MGFIIKTAPQGIWPGAIITACERPLYGGKAISEGDEVFIWFDESRGGHGLTSRGTVETVSQGNDDKLCLQIRISGSSFGKDDLETYRDVGDGSPQAELARKLYFHAHNKIAALDEKEAALLSEHLRRSDP